MTKLKTDKKISDPYNVFAYLEPSWPLTEEERADFFRECFNLLKPDQKIACTRPLNQNDKKTTTKIEWLNENICHTRLEYVLILKSYGLKS